MNPIITALLSYGMSGRIFHAPFIHSHKGFQLAGAWERSKKLIGDDYPGTASYPSIESVLQDKSIELVVINTPTYTHYDYARQALGANKHVIVEKAFTTTMKEAVELKTLAEKNGLVLSVFQNRRWDSDFQTVVKVVREGLLGDIVEASFGYDRYNPSLSPRAHKETAGPGVGVVYDLGPHLIDQALVLFGKPSAVYADIMITRENSQVEDYFEILLMYDNFRVRLHAGYFVREPVPSYVVHGKLGSFLKPRADVQEDLLQKGMKPNEKEYGVEPDEGHGLLHTLADGVVVREKVVSQPGNYLAYYDGIYGSIREGAAVPVSADDGLRTIQIIEAAYKSKERGSNVEIP